MAFDLLRYRITISPLSDDASLTALYRGAECFSEVFRSVVCTRENSSCADCPEMDGCPHFQLFSRLLSADPDSVRRHQKPPLPFVFSFPLPGAPPDADGLFSAELVLTGKAVCSHTHFADACVGFFQESGFRVDGCSSLDYQGNGVPDGGVAVLDAEHIVSGRALVSDPLTLELETPCILFGSGRQLRSFDPGPFLMGLVRRITSLASSYSGLEMDIDYRSLSRSAYAAGCLDSSVLMTSRSYSGLKQGLSGSCTVSGDLQDFALPLVLGELLHAGKGASFGYGRFRIA